MLETGWLLGDCFQAFRKLTRFLVSNSRSLIVISLIVTQMVAMFACHVRLRCSPCSSCEVHIVSFIVIFTVNFTWSVFCLLVLIPRIIFRTTGLVLGQPVWLNQTVFKLFELGCLVTFNLKDPSERRYSTTGYVTTRLVSRMTLSNLVSVVEWLSAIKSFEWSTE